MGAVTTTEAAAMEPVGSSKRELPVKNAIAAGTGNEGLAVRSQPAPRCNADKLNAFIADHSVRSILILRSVGVSKRLCKWNKNTVWQAMPGFWRVVKIDIH